MARAFAFACSLEAFSWSAELSCSKVSTWTSRRLIFSSYSRKDLSRSAIFCNCCVWSIDSWRPSPVRRRNSACSATCLARSCHQDTINIKYSTTYEYSSTKVTYNKNRMTAQDPLGYSSRPLDRLPRLLLRRLPHNQEGTRSNHRTLRLISSPLI